MHNYTLRRKVQIGTVLKSDDETFAIFRSVEGRSEVGDVNGVHASNIPLNLLCLASGCLTN